MCGLVPLRVLRPNVTDARVVSVPSYNLLLLNWYLLGVKMNLGHAHKTRFWYLLGVFSKFSDKHPRYFYGGVWGSTPPGTLYHSDQV